MDAADHDIDQIRCRRYACRQRRRGRHSRADVATRRQAWRARRRYRCRHSRRSAAVRRRRDYAGHIGAQRAGRPQDSTAFNRALHRCAGGDHSGRAVCVAISGDRPHRQIVRADHDRVVRDHRRTRHWRNIAPPERPGGARSALRVCLFIWTRLHWFFGSRCGVSVCHWRGSALRRHGPLWASADQVCVVRAGTADAVTQLRRSDRGRRRRRGAATIRFSRSARRHFRSLSSVLRPLRPL